MRIEQSGLQRRQQEIWEAETYAIRRRGNGARLNKKDRKLQPGNVSRFISGLPGFSVAGVISDSGSGRPRRCSVLAVSVSNFQH